MKRIIIIFLTVLLYTISLSAGMIKQYDIYQDRKIKNALTDTEFLTPYATKQYIEERLKPTPDTIPINPGDGHWWQGSYYKFYALMGKTNDPNIDKRYFSFTLSKDLKVDTYIFHFYNYTTNITDPDYPNQSWTATGGYDTYYFFLEQDTYSVTTDTPLGNIYLPWSYGYYSCTFTLNTDQFKIGENWIRFYTTQESVKTGIGSSRDESATAPHTASRKPYIEIIKHIPYIVSDSATLSISLPVNLTEDATYSTYLEIQSETFGISSFANYDFQILQIDTTTIPGETGTVELLGEYCRMNEDETAIRFYPTLRNYYINELEFVFRKKF